VAAPNSPTSPLTAKHKREKAIALRTKGRTWQQVADEIGYSGPAAACNAVQEYLRQYPSPDAEELRAVENLKLDYLEQKVHEDYLSKPHVVVTASGKVATRNVGIMTDDEGQPIFDSKGHPVYATEEVEDNEPVIRGVKALLDIAARRAKLNGLDTLVIREEKDDGTVDKEIEDLVGQILAEPANVPLASNERVEQ